MLDETIIEKFSISDLLKLRNNESIRRIKPTRWVIPMSRREIKYIYKNKPVLRPLLKHRVVVMD